MLKVKSLTPSFTVTCATCATYNINWLVFITEMKSVYSAVRTGSLNRAVCASFNYTHQHMHICKKSKIYYHSIFWGLIVCWVSGKRKVWHFIFVLKFLVFIQNKVHLCKLQHPDSVSDCLSAAYQLNKHCVTNKQLAKLETS